MAKVVMFDPDIELLYLEVRCSTKEGYTLWGTNGRGSMRIAAFGHADYDRENAQKIAEKFNAELQNAKGQTVRNPASGFIRQS